MTELLDLYNLRNPSLFLQIYVYNQTGKVIKAIIKSSVYNKMYHKSPNLVLTDKLFVSKASQDIPHHKKWTYHYRKLTYHY